MSLPVLDHAQVAAPPGCREQAVAFFSGLLGLQEVPKPMGGGGAWFRTGSVELHVGETPAFVPAEKAHVALRYGSVVELEVLREQLVAAGHPVRSASPLPGLVRFFTEDPWGNRLELCAPARSP